MSFSDCRLPYQGWSMFRNNEKLQMPVVTRLSASKFKTLETWCDASFRKRSEIIGMVLDRVLEIVEQQAGSEQPVEQFVRRLRLGPP